MNESSAAAPANAQYTWSTTPSTADWNLAGNWTGGLVSGIDTTLTFGASNTTTHNDNLAALFQLNPWAYLRDVLNQLAAPSANVDVSDLLPDFWARRNTKASCPTAIS